MKYRKLLANKVYLDYDLKEKMIYTSIKMS